MRLSERLALLALFQIDPEWGHRIALRALRLGLTPKPGTPTSARLTCYLAGLNLPNPVGLAAGFDKNAEAIIPLLHSGFGFIEVGAATPLAQPGNSHPRLFRLRDDRAAINRFGFNNQGAEVIARRLANRPETGVVGINLGANKHSKDRAQDFAKVLRVCGPFVDFATVNVSSPNTERLRDLQGAAALLALLKGVLEVRADLPIPIPIFLKIAPDLTLDDVKQIADTAQLAGIDGIIATNTTLSRDGLTSADRAQSGGLSGQPLFEPSTRILAQLANHTKAELPLIGVGGVASAAQAYAKIKAGASAVQLYTGLVYGGLTLGHRIAIELERLLAKDGHPDLASALGTDTEAWLG